MNTPGRNRANDSVSLADVRNWPLQLCQDAPPWSFTFGGWEKGPGPQSQKGAQVFLMPTRGRETVWGRELHPVSETKSYKFGKKSVVN